MSDRDAPPPPQPPPTVPLPPPPRRKRWIVPAAIGAVLAVGAGVAAYALASNDGGGDDTAPAGLELEDLEPALLMEDDVGGGFREASDTASDDNGSFDADDLEGPPECEELIMLLQGSDDDALSVGFEGRNGARLGHSLALHDEGEPIMDEARDAFEHCDTVKWDDGDTQGEMRFAANELDGLGSEAFELNIEVEATDPVPAEGEAYVIFMMRDGVVSIITGFGAVDPETLAAQPANRDLVRTLAERADELVRQVTEAA